MKYNHFMLDLETFSLDSDAAIVQIACVPFEFNTTEQYSDYFCTSVSILSSVAAGGTCSTATLNWWDNQPKELKDKVLNGTTHIKTALEDLLYFVRSNAGPKAKCWSHATFDPNVLMNACKGTNVKCPFNYYEFMDIRTLEYLAGYPKIHIEQYAGLRHDALADCTYQILYCRQLMQFVKERS